eukprot:2614245-Amphidinium_carterae.1
MKYKAKLGAEVIKAALTEVLEPIEKWEPSTKGDAAEQVESLKPQVPAACIEQSQATQVGEQEGGGKE